jgi:hypothetical protein
MIIIIELLGTEATISSAGWSSDNPALTALLTGLAGPGSIKGYTPAPVEAMARKAIKELGGHIKKITVEKTDEYVKSDKDNLMVVY